MHSRHLPILLVALGAAGCARPALVVYASPRPSTESARAPESAPAAGATAGPVTPPSPCAGLALDYDRAEQLCTTDRPPIPPPDPSHFSLSVDPVVVPGGAEAEVVVHMRNVSAQPLSLIFYPDCAFEVQVRDTEGQLLGREGGMVFGRLCAHEHAVAVALPPGGELIKRLRWAANHDRYECENQVCHSVGGTPISVGDYQIDVETPFSDPVGDDPRHRRARHVTGPLTVTSNSGAASAVASPPAHSPSRGLSAP